MASDEVSEQITTFIRERFLDGDVRGELRDTTPLLEWGVLNSLNTAELLGFLRDRLGAHVPPQDVNARNFQDVRHIAALVRSQLQIAEA